MKDKPLWMTVTLWVLGATSVANGIAMFLLPRMWFFQMVPGVPETGPFNAHLVADSGTFFVAVGIGLLMASMDPVRHVSAIAIAAIADLLHSILHIYSHGAGLLSLDHIATEILGIYLPTIVLIVLVAILTRRPYEAVEPIPHTV